MSGPHIRSDASMFHPEQNDNEESKGDDASMMSYSVPNTLGRASLSENTGAK